MTLSHDRIHRDLARAAADDLEIAVERLKAIGGLKADGIVAMLLPLIERCNALAERDDDDRKT